MLTPHVQNKTLHEEIDLTAAVAARPTDTAREDARPPESPKIHYFCYGLGSPDPWHEGHVTLAMNLFGVFPPKFLSAEDSSPKQSARHVEIPAISGCHPLFSKHKIKNLFCGIGKNFLVAYSV